MKENNQAVRFTDQPKLWFRDIFNRPDLSLYDTD